VIEHFRFPLTIFHPPPETKFLTGPAAVCIAKMSGNTHFVFIDENQYGTRAAGILSAYLI